jgi:nucleoside-diphosphate-sugar epimerase
MRVFVTGASGFLGTRMVPTLASWGHQVFALARSASSSEKVRVLGATPIMGDLATPETLSLPKIDAVVHAAAYFRFAGPRAPYFRANVGYKCASKSRIEGWRDELHLYKRGWSDYGRSRFAHTQC